MAWDWYTNLTKARERLNGCILEMTSAPADNLVTAAKVEVAGESQDRRQEATGREG